MRPLLIGARWAVAAVLLLAAVLKALEPLDAALAVASFQLTPPLLSLLVALTLPGVEAVAGAALLTGWKVRGAALVAAGLSVMFATVVVSVMVRRLDIECGCFGHFALSPRADFTTLMVDAVLLVLSLSVFFAAGRGGRGAAEGGR